MSKVNKKIQEVPQEVACSLDEMMSYVKSKLAVEKKTRAKRGPVSEEQRVVLAERAAKARQAKVAKAAAKNALVE